MRIKKFKFYRSGLLMMSVLLMTQGCSMRRLLISQAERIALHTVDGYFDIEDEQELLLRRDLSATWTWLRADIAPDVATTLDKVRGYFDDGLSQDEVDATYSEVEALRRRLAAELVPPAARFLASLKPAQLAYFGAELEESNEEMEKERETSPKRWQRRARDRTEERIERLYGEASNVQIEASLRLLPTDQAQARQFLAERRAAQSNFLDFMRQSPGEIAIADALRRWVENPGVFRPPEFQVSYQARLEQYRQWWVTVDQLATTKQRRHAQAVLAEWRDDLKELHLQAKKLRK